MKRLFGAALVAGALWLAGPSAINQAVASAPHAKAQTSATSGATDLSARRYYRRHYHHYGYRPYYRPYSQPYYYARPYYYRPYPVLRACSVSVRPRLWSVLVEQILSRRPGQAKREPGSIPRDLSVGQRG